MVRGTCSGDSRVSALRCDGKGHTTSQRKCEAGHATGEGGTHRWVMSLEEGASSAEFSGAALPGVQGAGAAQPVRPQEAGDGRLAGTIQGLEDKTHDSNR